MKIKELIAQFEQVYREHGQYCCSPINPGGGEHRFLPAPGKGISILMPMYEAIKEACEKVEEIDKSNDPDANNKMAEIFDELKLVWPIVEHSYPNIVKIAYRLRIINPHE